MRLAILVPNGQFPKTLDFMRSLQDIMIPIQQSPGKDGTSKSMNVRWPLWSAAWPPAPRLLH